MKKPATHVTLSFAAAALLLASLAGCSADLQNEVDGTSNTTLTISFTNNGKQTVTYAEDTESATGTVLDAPAAGSVVVAPGETKTITVAYSNKANTAGIDFGPKFTYTDAHGNANSVSAVAHVLPTVGENTISCTPPAGTISAANQIANELLTQTCNITAHGDQATATVSWNESPLWVTGAGS
jgi:hypothetical protein